MPMPPISAAPTSERMSPNMFSVTRTSKSHGARTSRRPTASTYAQSASMSGYCTRDLEKDLAEERHRRKDVRFVHAGHAAGPALLRAAGRASRERKLEEPLATLRR